MTIQLEQRIAQLEKNLRWHRFIFMGSAALIICLVIMSFNHKKNAPDILEAKAFHVVDDNGNVLVEINKEDGSGQLSTYSTTGKRLVSLLSTEEGAGGINTYDKSGAELFKVTNTKNGGGYLALFNGKLQEIAELGVTEIQSGYFRINDSKGNKMAWLTYTEDGGGYLSLSKDAQEMIRLSTPSIGGRVGIYNNANIRVGYMGVQANKDGNITVWDGTGTSTGTVPTSH